MIDSNRSLPNSQSQELMFSRKDVVPTLCLVVLAFAISWLSLGDDRTTTKGWFPAWFEQFRSFESGPSLTHRSLQRRSLLKEAYRPSFLMRTWARIFGMQPSWRYWALFSTLDSANLLVH